MKKRVSSLPRATGFLLSSKQVRFLHMRKKRDLTRLGLERFPHSLQCVEQLSFTDAVSVSRLESWPGTIRTCMACHQDRCRSGWLSTYSSIIPSNSELISFSSPSSTTLFFPQFMHLWRINVLSQTLTSSTMSLWSSSSTPTSAHTCSSFSQRSELPLPLIASPPRFGMSWGFSIDLYAVRRVLFFCITQNS